jgi:hypothetical protein
MSSTITVQNRVANANNFIESITTNTYLAYGRATTWEPTIETPNADDTTIPLAVDTTFAKKQLKQNLLSLKKIDASNAISAIRRIDYATGIVYDQYSCIDKDLYTKDFYVFTTDKHVYKCLFNNHGETSTIMPTGTSSIITTADGYIWRYMFTVNVSDENNFLTSNYIPIRSTSQSPIGGQIFAVNVLAVGTGYSYANVSINGSGSGFEAIANLSSGSIESITVTSYGSGYDYADIVITGDGNGCIAIAEISPENGHGSDLQNELGAFYAIFAPKVSYDESGDFLVNNDFRQISLIKGIMGYNSSDEYTLATASATIKIELTDSSAYSEDATITLLQDSIEVGTAIIVYNDIANNILHLANVASPTITASFTISDGINSDAILAVNYPDVNVYSGDILFYINRVPVNRNISQSETYKMVFSF